MDSDPKTAAESAHTKEEHAAAAAYHKEREQIARSGGRYAAAENHRIAAAAHEWVAKYGSESVWLSPEDLGKLLGDDKRTIADLARERSEMTRRFEGNKEYEQKFWGTCKERN